MKKLNAAHLTATLLAAAGPECALAADAGTGH